MREDADALGPAEPDRVLRQHALVLVHLPGEAIEEGVDGVVEAVWQVLAEAADADVAREQAEAREHLVDVEQQLPLAEAVHHHRDGADFHPVGAEPHQMARDALQFRDQDADVLHALGHLDAEQLLHRQHVGQGVGLRPEVVHALDERHDLLPLLLLGRLLDARVQVADRGLGAHDLLAIELDDEAQHAMGGGVLRPHVHRHRFGADFSHIGRRAPGYRLGSDTAQVDAHHLVSGMPAA